MGPSYLSPLTCHLSLVTAYLPPITRLRFPAVFRFRPHGYIASAFQQSPDTPEFTSIALDHP